MSLRIDERCLLRVDESSNLFHTLVRGKPRQSGESERSCGLARGSRIDTSQLATLQVGYILMYNQFSLYKDMKAR